MLYNSYYIFLLLLFVYLVLFSTYFVYGNITNDRRKRECQTKLSDSAKVEKMEDK